MREIDMAAWPRKEIFDFFSSTEKPFYSLSFRMDVAKAYRFAKSRGLSFYYSLIWLVTEAMNRVEAFRYSIEEGKVVLLPRREPSFTDIRPGAEYFHICTLPAGDSIEEFCRRAGEKSRSQKFFIDHGEEKSDLIYISALPWLDMMSNTNEGELHKDDCIPRLSWGKFIPEGEKKQLCFCFEVNHRFVDGRDIGRFAEELERLMDELE